MQDIKLLRKSLQQSDDLQLNEEEKSNANENSNSQDDDILEQIETPEPTETLKDMQLNKEFFQKNPEAKLRPGDLIVLDFGPNTKSKRKEQLLAVARKDDVSSYIPMKPLLVKSKSFDRTATPASNRQANLISNQECHERVLSAARRNTCYVKDPDLSASVVFQAMQKENEDVLKSMEKQNTVTKAPLCWQTHSPDPAMNGRLQCSSVKPNMINRAIERISLLEPSQQKKLRKTLETIEDPLNDRSSRDTLLDRNALNTETHQSVGVSDRLPAKDTIYISMEILSNWVMTTKWA